MRPSFVTSSYGMLLIALLGCAGDAESDAESAPADGESDTMAEAAGPGITVDGFAGPESALHDPEADVYLVSNVAGAFDARDGNGFLSRVSPEGRILDLRWIDGASEGVTLHAPKGMGLLGDTLLVADIDAVRLFDRESGEPLGAWPVEGASFLNDIAVADDGTIYVSDTGVSYASGEREDTGTSAIHAFAPDGARRTLDVGDVTGINGLATRGDVVYGVSSGSGTIFMLREGQMTELPELPGLGLDGVVAVDDGLLISDWDTETVYLLRDNGSLAALARNIASPADIGVDRSRGRLLIPGLTTDRLLLAPLNASRAGG